MEVINLLFTTFCYRVFAIKFDEPTSKGDMISIAKQNLNIWNSSASPQGSN